MIDHGGVGVGDYARSKAFYEQAPAPLGLSFMLEPVPQVGLTGNNIEVVSHGPGSE